MFNPTVVFFSLVQIWPISKAENAAPSSLLCQSPSGTCNLFSDECSVNQNLELVFAIVREPGIPGMQQGVCHFRDQVPTLTNQTDNLGTLSRNPRRIFRESSGVRNCPLFLKETSIPVPIGGKPKWCRISMTGDTFYGWEQRVASVRAMSLSDLLFLPTDLRTLVKIQYSLSIGFGKGEVQIQRNEGKAHTSSDCLLKIHMWNAFNGGGGLELKAEFQIGGSKTRARVCPSAPPINLDAFRPRSITPRHGQNYGNYGSKMATVVFPCLSWCCLICCFGKRARRSAARAGCHEMVPTEIGARSQVVPRNSGRHARGMSEASTHINGDEEAQLAIEDDGAQSQIFQPQPPPYDSFAPPSYEESVGITKQ